MISIIPQFICTAAAHTAVGQVKQVGKSQVRIKGDVAHSLELITMDDHTINFITNTTSN